MPLVTIDNPTLSIYESLSAKLLELRAKRDAIALHHEELKHKNDQYNKVIIVVSLLCAFVETVKMQFDLQGYDDWVSNVASLTPVFLSTMVSIVSSLLKFKKFPEKMETLVQVGDKANYAIEKIRKLQEYVHFQDDEIVFETYQKDVADSYRAALMSIETAIYPDKRAKYYKNAQQNFIKIQKDETLYVGQIAKHKAAQRVPPDPSSAYQVNYDDVIGAPGADY
jgi:hypothetical protein|tara:strand:- start:485 stop:1156 length:672 start_codon:yes stop_codon:yes gene_type:complete